MLCVWTSKKMSYAFVALQCVYILMLTSFILMLMPDVLHDTKLVSNT